MLNAVEQMRKRGEDAEEEVEGWKLSLKKRPWPASVPGAPNLPPTAHRPTVQSWGRAALQRWNLVEPRSTAVETSHWPLGPCSTALPTRLGRLAVVACWQDPDRG